VPGGHFHIGKLFKPSGNIPFHLAIWKALNDPLSVKSFTMEFTIPGPQRYEYGDRMHAMLFREAEDLEAFTAWWDQYKKRFGEDDIEKCQNAYPTIKEGMHVNGYAFKHGLGSASDTRRGFHDWCWIVGHTTGKVTMTSDYWIFEDEAEMVQMKLRGKPEFKRGFDYMEILSGQDTESYADIDSLSCYDEDEDEYDENDWNDPF
jgi:hypothetical protein